RAAAEVGRLERPVALGGVEPALQDRPGADVLPGPRRADAGPTAVLRVDPEQVAVLPDGEEVIARREQEGRAAEVGPAALLAPAPPARPPPRPGRVARGAPPPPAGTSRPSRPPPPRVPSQPPSGPPPPQLPGFPFWPRATPSR